MPPPPGPGGPTLPPDTRIPEGPSQSETLTPSNPSSNLTFTYQLKYNLSVTLLEAAIGSTLQLQLTHPLQRTTSLCSPGKITRTLSLPASQADAGPLVVWASPHTASTSSQPPATMESMVSLYLSVGVFHEASFVLTLDVPPCRARVEQWAGAGAAAR